MSGVHAGHIIKLRKSPKVKSRSVLRMMAVMQDRNSKEEVPKEFLETGRTGRRNAMPDILHPQGAETTTADLPAKLEQLATSDPVGPQPGTSKSDLSQDLSNKPGDSSPGREGCS